MLAVIAATVVVAASLAVPQIRSIAAYEAARAYLAQRWGLELAGGDVHIAADGLEIDGLVVDDRNGQPMFAASRVDAGIDRRVWWGRSDRAAGLRSLELVDPSLRIVREPDGTYDLPSLAKSGGGAAAPGPPSRFTLRITRGTFTFADPTAPAAAGREVVVGDIAASGEVDRSAVSRIRLHGAMAGAGPSGVFLTYDADAPAGLSRVSLRAHEVALAPVVDSLAPTTSYHLACDWVCAPP